MGTILITYPVHLVFPEGSLAQPTVLASKPIPRGRRCSHPERKRSTVLLQWRENKKDSKPIENGISREGVGGGMNWETGIDIYTLLYI